MDQGLTVEEADQIGGRPMGVPKTGIFGLVDLVGVEHAVAILVEAGLDHDAAAVLLLTLIAGLGDEHALAPDVTTPAVIESALRQVIGGLLR